MHRQVIDKYEVNYFDLILMTLISVIYCFSK